MNRKIIQISKNTFVISLPAKWMKEEKLSKGDELEVFTENEKLICIPATQGKTTRSISIDIKGLNDRVVRWTISSLHKQGWDDITLINYSPKQLKVIEEMLNNLFIGFMIKEKHKTSLTIGEIAHVDIKEFDSSLRRAFRQLNNQVEDLIRAFKEKNEKLLREQYKYEHNNNKLTNFCERLLNSNLVQKEKGHFWYVIAWNLEKISDNFKYIVKYFDGAIINLSPEVMGVLEDLKTYIKNYYKTFYSFSFDELILRSEEKNKLEKKILQLLAKKSASHEAIVLTYTHMAVLQMVDMSASTVALRFDGLEKAK